MVGRPLAPWTQKIVEILTPPEGESPEWVDFKVIMDIAGPFVPYERAVHHMRQRSFTTIDAAQRDIVSVAIRALKTSKKIELTYKLDETNHRVIDHARLTPKGITNKAAIRSNSHPWTLKALEMLEDGEWHPYDEILDGASVLVPPGMAWRQAEESRLRHYKKTEQPPRERTKGDRTDTIKSGQRYYVIKALKTLRKGDRIEVEYGTQEIKKRPVRMRLKQ